jgi:hypothetical protein
MLMGCEPFIGRQLSRQGYRRTEELGLVLSWDRGALPAIDRQPGRFTEPANPSIVRVSITPQYAST